MIRKIYLELVAIRKELQAIRSNLESRKNITIDSKDVYRAVRDEEALEKRRGLFR